MLPWQREGAPGGLLAVAAVLLQQKLLHEGADEDGSVLAVCASVFLGGFLAWQCALGGFLAWQCTLMKVKWHLCWPGALSLHHGWHVWRDHDALWIVALLITLVQAHA